MTDSYIFIYGDGRLGAGLDKVEDQIQQAIEPFAEVSGSGTGESGWNIDIVLESVESINHVLSEVSQVISSFVPISEWRNLTIDVSGVRMSFHQMKESLK